MARVKDGSARSPRNGSQERQSGSGDATQQGHHNDLVQTTDTLGDATPPRPPLDTRIAQMTGEYHQLMDTFEQQKLVDQRAMQRSRSRSPASPTRSRSGSRSRSLKKKRSRADSSSTSSSDDSTPRRKRKARSRKKKSKKSKKSKKRRRRSPSTSSSSEDESSSSDSSPERRKKKKRGKKFRSLDYKERKQSEAILAKFARFLEEAGSEDGLGQPEEGELPDSDGSVDDWTTGVSGQAATPAPVRTAPTATPTATPTSTVTKADLEKIKAAQAEAVASGVDPAQVEAFGKVLALAHEAFDEQVKEGDPINKSYAKIVEAALR